MYRQKRVAEYRGFVSPTVQNANSGSRLSATNKIMMRPRPSSSLHECVCLSVLPHQRSLYRRKYTKVISHRKVIAHRNLGHCAGLCVV